MMVISMLSGYFLEIITLFTIVMIHELGHVAAAKGFGWNVTEVMLLPFGGVATVDEQGGVPVIEDLIVTIAGPLQNALMISIAFGMLKLDVWEQDFTDYFIQANVLILGFNLLPVLPLDGGRIMQSLLSLWLPFHRTMIWSAWISLFIGGAIVAMAVTHSFHGKIELNWIVLGLFLIYSNWYSYLNAPYQFLRFIMNREYRAARHLEHGVLAKPIVVRSNSRIYQIVRLFMREQYHLIYVVNEKGVIEKVLPEQRLSRSYCLENKPSSAVSDLFM